MKKKLASLLVTAAVLLPAAQALAHTAYPIGAVNVRSGPGTGYSIMTVLQDGQTATVLSHEGNWLKVRTSSGVTGFVADWVTREVFDDETIYVQVDTDLLNLRSGPGSDSAIIGQLRQGQRFRALEGLGGWYKLDAGALGTGWASKDFLFRVAQPPASQPPGVTPPPESPAPTDPVVASTKAVAAATATAMYAGRDVRTAKEADIRPFEQLTYLTAAEGWVKVRSAAGKQGWVDGTHVYLWDKGVPFSYQASYGMMENDWRMRYLKVREVVAGGGGLNLRASADAGSAVKRTLSAGERLKLLYVGESEFVQVMLADGETGWVSRNYLKPVTGVPTEAVRLYRVAENVLRLEISEQGAATRVSAAGSELQIALPANSGRTASLEIGKYDIASMNLGANGLNVRFTQPFSHKVLEQTATRTVVELRPVVQKVEALQAADRVTYRFTTVGSFAAKAVQESGTVALTLPGAVRVSGAVVAPAGMTLQEVGGSLVARVPAAGRFAIKHGAGYTDLVVYAPGLAGKVIALDPGHGGIESGAVGPTGMTEKEANLAITLKLAKLLEGAGAKVVLTRSADTRCASAADLAPIPVAERLRFDLNCRAVTANTAQVDSFLSVHSNAHPNGTENGTETYWTNENLNADQSWLLATLVQRELVGTLGLRDRGVKNDMFYVIKYTEAPAALAEIAYVNWAPEEALLKSDAFRQKAAEAMFRALQAFYR